jgi:glutamine synthetase
MSETNQNNILLEYNFQFVSYKSIDILGRLTQSDISFREFCNKKDEPKYFRYFADPFRNEPTLNVFLSSASHKIASQVESLLRIKKIELSIQLSIDFFIFDRMMGSSQGKSLFNELLTLNNLHQIKTVYPYSHLDHVNSVDPIDQFSNIRSEIVLHLEKLGILVLDHAHKKHHGHCSIRLAPTDFVTAANNFIIAKYIIKNIVASYGKTVTFMPKPTSHISSNLTASLVFDGMSARNFAVGVAKHTKAINAFANASLNSFKKLRTNREIADAEVIEVNKHVHAIDLRFLDCIGNPYLALSVIILAGLSFESKDNESYPHEKNVKLKFADSLDSSLNSIKKNLDFCHNILEQSFIENYIKAVKDNEDLHNLNVSLSEIMIYYNM